MDPCTAAGYTPYVDPTSGVVLYCIDLNGNAVQLSDLPGITALNNGTPQPPSNGVPYPSTAPQTVSPTPGQPSTLGIIGGIENDFLAGYKAITQPGLPQGQVGISLGLGAAGGTLSGSPILLVGIIVIAFLVFRKEL